MQPDILANAIKAGISAGITAVTEAEMAANDSKNLESMNQTLYGFVKSDLLVQPHSSLPKVHQNLSTTVLNFRRTMLGRLHKAQQELKMIDPGSKGAEELKEEIAALKAFSDFLKKISTENLDSSEKIKALEKTLEKIIEFKESYVVAKAGSYISHYTVLLAGLVGIPALGVTLAIPATQALGVMIAQKYYEHQKDKTEQKGQRLVDDSKLNLQAIALEFLELKTNPYNKNNSPAQAAYLDALKKTIDLEIDINKNLAAIHDYVILNEVYLKPDAKSADVLQRFTFIDDKIKSLQAELKEPRYIIFNNQSHYSSSNSADALKRQQIIAQIALLQSERTILQPIVQDLHKPGKSAGTETKSLTDQYQQRQVELKTGVKKDQATIRPLIDTGINMSNIIKASKNGYDLGGIVSPGTGESSGVVSPFDNDPDSSDDEQFPLEDSDKSGFNPRKLLDLPLETGDEKDEKSSSTPEPTSPNTSQKAQKDKISAPKTVAEDKAPVLSKDTLKTIVAELDKYSGKRSNPSFLNMRTDAEKMKKTASALACKSICTGQIEGVRSHQEILTKLGALKENYIEKHAQSSNNPFVKLMTKTEDKEKYIAKHSPFVKLVTEIEDMVKQDQIAQASTQMALTR